MQAPTTTSPSEDTPLGEAKDWLRERLDDGTRCPCCTQFAKVYRRKINSSMARALVAMYREEGTGWCYLPDIRRLPNYPRTNEEPMLRWWGFIVERDTKREDGGRMGEWKITPAGVEFVTGKSTTSKYARCYSNRCLNLVGEQVSIHDALGSRFRLDELMAGV